MSLTIGCEKCGEYVEPEERPSERLGAGPDFVCPLCGFVMATDEDD